MQSDESSPLSSSDISNRPPKFEDALAGPEWDKPKRGRRRRVSRKRLRRRRRIGLAMLLFGGFIVLCGMWVLVTGLVARSQLQAVSRDVHRLRAEISAGDLTDGRATASRIASHAHTAHLLTMGPVWAAVSAIPQGGEPLATIRAMTAEADILGRQSLPVLASASGTFDLANLRRADGSINLDQIAAVAPALDHGVSDVDAATSRIVRQPAKTWLSSVDRARASLVDQLQSLRQTLTAADVVAHVAPAMLGAEGPRRYFLAFQNNAEARGTGGLPGAFAILQADHGKLEFLKFEPDNTLNVEPVSLDFGTDYNQLYQGALTTTKYQNSNLSANFPYAAQIWVAMWQKHSGQRLDGALAIDPQAMSYLLSVTGPVTLPNGSQVSARNIVPLTESRVYAIFPTLADQNARKKYLVDVARAVSERLLVRREDTTALLRALGLAVSQRRLLLWSGDPATEAQLEPTAISGAIPVTTAPFVGLSIVNDGGNKLDYYLDRSLSWTRSGCGSVRTVTVTVTLTNNTPATGVPAFVESRSDRHAYLVQPGDSRLEVSYYATSGAQMTAVDIDGAPATAVIGSERGHPVYVIDVELPRGQTRAVTIHLREPAGVGGPIVLRQPLVRPITVKIDDATC